MQSQLKWCPLLLKPLFDEGKVVSLYFSKNSDYLILMKMLIFRLVMLEGEGPNR